MRKLIWKLVELVAVVNAAICVYGLWDVGGLVNLFSAWLAVGSALLILGVVNSYELRVKVRGNMFKHARDCLVFWPVTLYEQWQFNKELDALYEIAKRLETIKKLRPLTMSEKEEVADYMRRAEKLSWFKENQKYLKDKK